MIFTQTTYILNMVFIAVPWTIFGVILISWNLYLNIAFNEGWAGGNLWLIFNTVYLIL